MNKNEREFTRDFILESNLIDGIIYNEPALLLNAPFDKNKGHWGAIKYAKKLAEQGSFLHELDIIKIQELILTEQKRFTAVPNNFIGQYRKINVPVAIGKMKPHFDRVPSMMKRFITKVRKWQAHFKKHCHEQNIEIIGRFHYDFEKIHPFAYGNGRTGRVIALFMILYAKLTPFLFTSVNNKESYYPSFKERNEMAEYFLEKYRENLKLNTAP